MIPVPTRKILNILVFPLILLCFGLIFRNLLLIGVFIDIVFLLYCISDIYAAILLVSGRDRIVFKTDFSRVFSIGRKNKISVKVINRCGKNLRMEVLLESPDFWLDLSKTKA